MVLGFDFDRLRSGPFEEPAIVKPPAMPGDTYFGMRNADFGIPPLRPLLKGG
jgi:hypothetical protein